MDISRFLPTVPLFSGLTPSQYRELAAITVCRTFRRGQTIFSEGEPGEGFFVVATGRVKIFKLSPEGKEQILHLFGPGEPFAEAAVFTGSSYPAHALALEESQVLFIRRAAFIKLIDHSPGLAMNMLAALSRRLKQFAYLIEDLSLKEVPGRLAAHLLYLSSQQGNQDTIRLPTSKAQLASLLGTIPETLSRILARLGKQGLIRSRGGTIEILDREALASLASGERIR